MYDDLKVYDPKYDPKTESIRSFDFKYTIIVFTNIWVLFELEVYFGWYDHLKVCSK